MDLQLKHDAKAERQLHSIERRTSQLWLLATIIIGLLGAAVVLLDMVGAAFNSPMTVLGIHREYFRLIVILCVFLVSGYFWEKVRELRGINAYLIQGLQHYAESLERRNAELSALNALSEKLIGSVDLDSGLQTVLDISMKAAQANAGTIYIYDKETDEFVVKVTQGTEGELEIDQRVKAGDKLLAWVARNGEPIVLDKASRSSENTSSMTVPLSIAGETVGVMSISNRWNSVEFSPEDLEMLVAFANQAATVIERTQLYAQLRNHVAKLEETLRAHDETRLLSVTDALTELGNRRQFDSLIDTEFQRAQRYERPLSLIMVDLDGFKEYNDTYGHMAGDLLLRRVGKLLRSSIRSEGNASRYGGDEFAVILPECDPEAARAVAERLRNRIEQESESHGLSGKTRAVTASFGVASFPYDVHTKEELIKAADDALYKSKNQGKNRVFISSEVLQPVTES